MTSARRLLGIDDARWARVGPTSAWPAIAIAVAASVFMALNRFGGALVDAPRSFARLTLIGVWGWLGLGIMVWLFAALITGHAPATTPGASLQHTLVVVGLAHTPLLLLGLAIFAVANLLQTLGPGMVAAAFVFGLWFPSALAMATRHAHDLSLARAVAVVAVPYSLWLLVIGRHLLGQVQHLL